MIEDTDGSDDEEKNMELNKNQDQKKENKTSNEPKEVVKRQIKVTEVESDNEDEEECGDNNSERVLDESQNKRIDQATNESKERESEKVNIEKSVPQKKSYVLQANLAELKDLANQAFTRGQYDEAMKHYTHIIKELEANGN